MLKNRLYLATVAAFALCAPAGDDGAASGTSSAAPSAADIAAAQDILRRAGEHPAAAAAAVVEDLASAAAPAAPATDPHLLTLQAHASNLNLAEMLVDDVIDVWNKFRHISNSDTLKQLAHSLLTSAALFIGK